MGIIGLGNETYLYVNGIVVNREIILYDHVTLLPVSAELDSNVASKLIEKMLIILLQHCLLVILMPK